MIGRRAALRAGLALAAGLVLAGGVRVLTAPAPDISETFYVFGTLLEVETHGVPEAQARDAMAVLGAHFRQMHRDWHAWAPGELESLNAAIAAGQSFEVDPGLAKLLQQGRDLACRSEGLFDPAVGGMVEAWGFHADTPPAGDPPSDAVVAKLLAGAPKMTDLTIEGTTVRSSNPAVQLDLGAYAKGAALDLAEADLTAAGISDAVLNAGGGVQVLGDHGSRPWRVAIRDPFEWGVVGAVSLRPGEALHTSGNYERYFDKGGIRFSHIIDPRTARPMRGVVSVSVLSDNGALSDAAATALCVAGEEDWPRIAAQMGVRAVLRITDDGSIFATPEMRARLEAVEGGFPAPITVVDLPKDVAIPLCPEG
ncbi:FAD:protein FMN transferase [Rhodobacter capsulatus]|uniref:FAD:protein FMN transferase n=1 Tax=Rhodobacter capsulatus TaxID=1061 RepID=UPI0003D3B313|nr:FAD:protein FMN transferase [Rhodobacter capsulatus]ETD80880.1 thiamine biosynthesis protein ApbE [Rhodobacter capsulatus YW1]